MFSHTVYVYSSQRVCSPMRALMCLFTHVCSLTCALLRLLSYVFSLCVLNHFALICVLSCHVL